MNAAGAVAAFFVWRRLGASGQIERWIERWHDRRRDPNPEPAEDRAAR